MAGTPKNIKFRYAILVYEEDGIEKKFDFEAWLEQMKLIDYKERTKSVYANYARLDKWQEKDERDGLIGLLFLRLRDTNLPYKVPISEEAKDLGIEDNEYIGESLHIIYDTETRYFMVQMNRFSINLNGLAAYINQLNCDPKKSVRFKVFHKEINSHGLRFNRYKTLEIGVANVGEFNNINPTGFFGKVLDGMNDYSARTIKIIMSIGAAKKKSLTNRRIEEILDEIPDYRECVTIAKLKHCEGDSEKGDEINLLDFLEESTLTINIPERKAIDFEDTIKVMKQEYLTKKQSLKRMLKED